MFPMQFELEYVLQANSISGFFKHFTFPKVPPYIFCGSRSQSSPLITSQKGEKCFVLTVFLQELPEMSSVELSLASSHF